jgi:hypothetical protein
MDKESPWAHMELEFWPTWDYRKACEIYGLLVQKEKKEFKLFLFLHHAQTTNDELLVSRNFRG